VTVTVGLQYGLRSGIIWRGGKKAAAEFDISLSLSQTYYFYRKSLELATGEIDRIHLETNNPTGEDVLHKCLKRSLSSLRTTSSISTSHLGSLSL
jgi:hypothetical protein